MPFGVHVCYGRHDPFMANTASPQCSREAKRSTRCPRAAPVGTYLSDPRLSNAFADVKTPLEFLVVSQTFTYSGAPLNDK